MGNGKRILILRLGAMGDILFTTPAVRALKARFPESHITYVVLKKWRFLLTGNPSVDRVVGLRYREPKALGGLRHEKYDLIINFNEDDKGAQLCEALNAAERKGHRWQDGQLQPDAQSQLLVRDKTTFQTIADTGVSYPEIFCKVAGVDSDLLRYDFTPGVWASFRAKWEARRLQMQSNVEYVALHIHSRGMGAKSWSTEAVRKVISALPKRHFLVLGYAPDRQSTQPLEAEPNVKVTLAPIAVQAALMRHCGLFVGIDSGPRQIAAAMGLHALCLFGPRRGEHLPSFPGDQTLSAKWPCAPCFDDICPRRLDCLDQIPAEQIISKIEELS